MSSGQNKLDRVTAEGEELLTDLRRASFCNPCTKHVLHWQLHDLPICEESMQEWMDLLLGLCVTCVEAKECEVVDGVLILSMSSSETA
jgi:hypothetical protein